MKYNNNNERKKIKMTIHQIIKVLQRNIKPYEEYVVEYEVMEAMNTISNGEELIKPILELIGNYPMVDFGTPGYLVHFVEKFYNKGYEELLMQSVIKTPTSHNIWMLHRCYNNANDTKHNIYKMIAMDLKNSDTTPIKVKKQIDFYDWD